jgi:hypothetical protein
MIEVRDIPNLLPFDISVEALVASIMECYAEDFPKSEQFLVTPKGHLTRRSGKEVQEISHPWVDEDDLQYLRVDINREGLYNSLPPILLVNLEEEAESIVEQAQILAKHEEDARQFFAPFEQFLYNTRIQLELKERELNDKPEQYLSFLWGDLFEEVDEICKDLPQKQAALRKRIIIYLMPKIEQILCNTERLAQTLSFILKRKVIIKEQPPKPYIIPDEYKKRIGSDMALGENMLIGQTFFDGMLIYDITVEVHNIKEVANWLEEGVERKYFDNLLYPLFFSAESTVNFNIHVPEKYREYTLNDNAPTHCIGYSFYI